MPKKSKSKVRIPYYSMPCNYCDKPTNNKKLLHTCWYKDCREYILWDNKLSCVTCGLRYCIMHETPTDHICETFKPINLKNEISDTSEINIEEPEEECFEVFTDEEIASAKNEVGNIPEDFEFVPMEELDNYVFEPESQNMVKKTTSIFQEITAAQVAQDIANDEAAVDLAARKAVYGCGQECQRHDVMMRKVYGSLDDHLNMVLHEINLDELKVEVPSTSRDVEQENEDNLNSMPWDVNVNFKFAKDNK